MQRETSEVFTAGGGKEETPSFTIQRVLAAIMGADARFAIRSFAETSFVD